MQYALDVCRLICDLPDAEPGPTIRHQLAKSATSVAFNYRASCRARSHREFTSRIGLVAEEADESLGWLEFIEAGTLVSPADLSRLIDESRQLAAIFSASFGTARRRRRVVP
jgi:four helix bundle protein